MRFTSFAARFSSLGDALEYILGRFYLVRRLRRLFFVFSRASWRHRQTLDSVFLSRHKSAPAILAELRANAISSGLALSDDVLFELFSRINSSTAFIHGTSRLLDSVEDARSLNRVGSEEKILIIDHRSPALDSLALEIARDPFLFDIASSYLGAVTDIEARIQTSLVVQATDDYRESRFQTVMFHYDVAGYNFLYCFFYLSPTDELSGAHEMVIGSHRHKRLDFLFSSARQPTRVVYQYYQGKSMVVKGDVGAGFFEDTSCYHRALPPVDKERICLQLRYKG